MKALRVLLIVLWGLALAGCAAVEEGLAGHWDFDKGRGGVLHDRSGEKNHGVIHGAEWVKCGTGHALRFDGRDDYVAFLAFLMVQITQFFCVSTISTI